MYTRLILLFLFPVLLTSCGEKVEQEIQVKNVREQENTGTTKKDTSTNDSTFKEPESDTTNSSNISGGEQEQTTLLSTRAAGKHIGENGTVKGYVADVNKREKVWYLNFDDKYPNNTFTGVIFPRNFDAFPDAEQYEGKTVEISGEISEYNGKPQIILNDPSQIKIID